MKNIFKNSYETFPKFLMRNPIFSINELFQWYENNDKEKLLNGLKIFFQNPIAQEALYIGSPDLFEQLQLWLSNSIDKADKKEKTEISLIKYMIRACARCTPFGLFATCSIGDFDNYTDIQLSNTSNCLRNGRLDMDYVCQIANHLLKEKEIVKQLQFFKNTSLYKIANSYRYIEHRFAQNNGRSYHLVQIESNEYIDAIINKVEHGCKISDLINVLISDDITEIEAEEFIFELIQAQILISELEPNVTGNDFIAELLLKLKNINGIDQFTTELEKVQVIFNRIKTKQLASSVGVYKDIATILKSLAIPLHLKTLIQVDTYRNLENQKLNQKIADDVLLAQSVLLALNGIPDLNNPFSEFINAFVEKYESQFVPLVEVLDSELGLGYQRFGTSGQEEAPLISDLPLHANGSSSNGNTKNTSVFKWKIYEKAIKENTQIIELDENNIAQFIHKDIHCDAFPNSVYSMAKVYANNASNIDSENYLIETHPIAGPSAANLLGRFCHLNDGIKQMSVDLLGKEESINPEFVFAEIVHLPESRIGNILMRPHLRNYEIVYLCNSTLQKENQIAITDLLIGIQNNEVVLYSKKLNKRVIPRMSTAHNFHNTTLPIYQFLCDLQHQKTRYCGWSWEGLDTRPFLPRVQYKNIILCKAKWVIAKTDIENFDTLTEQNYNGDLCNLLNKNNIPNFVYLSQGDNELLLNINNFYCQKIILENLKKYGTVQFTEALESPNLAWVKGENGFHSNEFIFGFSKKVLESTVEKIEKNFNKTTKIKRVFTTGSQWLYVKIYCGNKSAEHVLSAALKPLCDELEAEGIVEKYFFLRYSDPKNHIRFRFYNCNNPDFWKIVLDKLHTALEPLVENQLVYKFQTDTYQREIERYGVETMEDSESIFYFQSKGILQFISLLEGDEGEQYRWQIALKAVDMMLNDFGYSLEQKQLIAKIGRESFMNEFGLNADQKKKISDKFYASRNIISKLIEMDNNQNEDLQIGINCFINSDIIYKNTIKNILESKFINNDYLALNGIMTSYIHMFINRIFMSNQRKHELVIYDYLLKYYEGKIAREKHSKKLQEEGI